MIILTSYCWFSVLPRDVLLFEIRASHFLFRADKFLKKVKKTFLKDTEIYTLKNSFYPVFRLISAYNDYFFRS